MTNGGVGKFGRTIPIVPVESDKSPKPSHKNLSADPATVGIKPKYTLLLGFGWVDHKIDPNQLCRPQTML